jgi:hypothetical protein
MTHDIYVDKKQFGMHVVGSEEVVRGAEMIDVILLNCDLLIGPIHFESNRKAVVAMASCAIIRGVLWSTAIRYGRIVGNHVLNQRRIDRSLRLK